MAGIGVSFSSSAPCADRIVFEAFPIARTYAVELARISSKHWLSRSHPRLLDTIDFDSSALASIQDARGAKYVWVHFNEKSGRNGVNIVFQVLNEPFYRVCDYSIMGAIDDQLKGFVSANGRSDIFFPFGCN